MPWDKSGHLYNLIRQPVLLLNACPVTTRLGGLGAVTLVVAVSNTQKSGGGVIKWQRIPRVVTQSTPLFKGGE